MTLLDRSIGLLLDLAPAALLFALIALLAGRVQTIEYSKTQSREKRINLFIAVFDSLFIVPIVALPYLYLVEGLGLGKLARINWDALPSIVAVICAVVIGDFVGYLRHRAEHSFWLWPVHATHHSDEAMNWLTLFRIHPLNRFTTVTIDTTILMLCGFPPLVFLLNGLVRHWWGYFIHADVPWTLGPIGQILISPAAHRVHHAKDEALAGRNFATVFTFWDKAWGTWQDPRELVDVATGIEEGSPGFLAELGRPFVLWGRMIADRKTRRSAPQS